MQHKRFNTDNSSNSAQVKEKPELWDYLLVVGSTINRLGCMQCLLSQLFYVCSSNISYSTLYTHLSSSSIEEIKNIVISANKTMMTVDDGNIMGQAKTLAWHGLSVFRGKAPWRYIIINNNIFCVSFFLYSCLCSN